MDSSAHTLSTRVAEEIRAMLGRKRVTGRELSRRLGVSQPWVSQRLTGHQEIGLNDLQRIAEALEIEVADLLPEPAYRDERPPRRPSVHSSEPTNGGGVHALNVRSVPRQRVRTDDLTRRTQRPVWRDAGVTS